MNIDHRDSLGVAQERLRRATPRDGTLVNRDQFLRSAARMRQGVVSQGVPAEGIRDAFNLDRARLNRGGTYLGDYSTPGGPVLTRNGPYSVRNGAFRPTNRDDFNDSMVKLRSGKYVFMADMLASPNLAGIPTYTLGEPRIEDQFSGWHWAALWIGLLGLGTAIGASLTKGTAMQRLPKYLPYAAIAPAVGAFFIHAAPRLLAPRPTYKEPLM